MSAATSTIITIAAIGASSAASAYAAKKSSDASKKASEQQTQSAQEALGLQKSMYDTTRQDLAPYRESGQQGLTALSSFLLGRPKAYGAGGANVPLTGTPIPGARQAAPGAAMGAPAGSPMGAPPSAPAGGPPPGMVAMRSPNGQMGYVPQARVPDALAAGGSVVR